MLNVYITEFQEGKGPLISGGKNTKKKERSCWQSSGGEQGSRNVQLGASFPLLTNIICGFGSESDQLGGQSHAPLTVEWTVFGVLTFPLKSA